MHKKPFWFKRRRWGYGWFPVTKQGWLVLAGFLVLLFLGAMYYTDKHLEMSIIGETAKADKITLYFVLYCVVLVLLLIIVCLKRGPKPKWRWGKKPGDNPDEDF